MTSVRRRSPFQSHRTHFVPAFISRHRAASILLVRTTAGVALMGGLVTASRLMYSLSWRADGLIAAIAAAAWILCIEHRVGGL